MRFSAPATVFLLGALSTVEARGHGSLLAPRQYQYSRPSSAIDLVSDIFSVPLFQSHVPSQMSNFMRQLDTSGLTSGRNNSPYYEVYHNPETNSVELTMEIPGVAAKDLSVELENQSLLRVKGTRHGRTNGQSYKSEFDQVFKLDNDVDPDQLKVTLSSGVLRVIAPKKINEVKRLSIDVKEVEETSLNDDEDPHSDTEVVDGIEISTDESSS